MNLPLLALFFASFGIGTTEYVIVGLLPEIANNLHISIPQAGMLVTSYALSVAFGSPVLAMLTAKLPRRSALLFLMLIFLVGNMLCAMATSYSMLIIARVLTALCHGAFFGLGAVVASSLVPVHKKTQGIAWMFAGLTFANVMGVPLGTALGQVLGWRATFWAVTGIGLIAMTALYIWLPRNLSFKSHSIFKEFKAILNTQVLLTMGISIFASTSLFSVFTYIAPMMENITRINQHSVTMVLLVFGLGITLGNLIGGKLADTHLMATVISICILLSLVLSGFSITVFHFLPAMLTVFCWGLLSFGLIAPLQMRVVNAANGAPNLASTINQSAFHIGNASGAFISGYAISQGLSLASLPWLGASIMLIALTLSLWSYALDFKREKVLLMDNK